MVLLLCTFIVCVEFCLAKRYPTLVISFDGCRSSSLEEFLTQNPEAAINKFSKEGVKADYLQPSFPSATFPNHVTLVTGLYPESHGIVANTVYDPAVNAKRRLQGGGESLKIHWWNQSEPIWMTAKNQGLKTATMFWAGSDVPTRTADIWHQYNQAYPYLMRIDDVVNWLKKFEADLVFLYFDEPDSTGHTYGPDSVQYKKKIHEMDDIFGKLIAKLNDANLYDQINILLISDHGMATMRTNSTILIKNYINESLIDANKTVYGIVSNIFTLPDYEATVYKMMQSIPHVNTYYKHQVPEEFHYSKNSRIGDIVAIASEGYMLMSDYPTWISNGQHGFNNTLESMRAIFMARGPNFSKNQKIKSFSNVNIYPLICHLTEIKCLPNNGSIRVFENVLVSSSTVSIVIYKSLYLILFCFTISM